MIKVLKNICGLPIAYMEDKQKNDEYRIPLGYFPTKKGIQGSQEIIARSVLHYKQCACHKSRNNDNKMKKTRRFSL